MARQVVVGEIAGAFGVKGWVKVHSYTDPPDNILRYSPWILVDPKGAREVKVISGRMHGPAVIAQLDGVEERDQALELRRCKIYAQRDRFPQLEPGCYYWADLVGLRISNMDGVDLGTVAGMMETGANDVIIAKGERERLIPFVIGQFVKEIDLAEGTMTVDWDAEF